MQSIQMQPGEQEIACIIQEETEAIAWWFFASIIVFILLAIITPIIAIWFAITIGTGLMIGSIFTVLSLPHNIFYVFL